MLKHSYPSKDQIPAGAEGFYKEVGGAWVLQVEGMVPSEKVAEFRNTNQTLKEANEDLTKKLAKFENVDVEEFRRLKGIENDLKEDKLFNKNEIDKLVGNRTREMTEEHKRQLDAQVVITNEAKEKLTKAESQLSDHILKRGIVIAAEKKGKLKPGSNEALELIAEKEGKVENGQIVFYDKSGNKRYSKTNAVDLMGPDEWIEEAMTQRHKYLWEESHGSGSGDNQGGGGQGGGGGGETFEFTDHLGEKRTAGTGAGHYNPWKKETYNLTNIGIIIDKNRPLAERMAAAHGKKLPPKP